ncbi:hypothetical protein GCM10023157_29010 [Gluconacetobacter asukensis]
MVPTEFGKIVLEYIEKSFSDYHGMLNTLEEIKKTGKHHVRIHTLDSFMVSIIPSAIMTLTTEMPEVTFSVVAGRPSDMLYKLQHGQTDIVITFLLPSSPVTLTHAIFSTPSGAIVSSAHPLASQSIISLNEMLNYRLLLPMEPLPQPASDNLDYIAFRRAASSVCRSNEIGFVKKLIMQGVGIGCYTKVGYIDEIEENKISWIPTDNTFLNSLKTGIFSSLSASAGTSSVIKRVATCLGQVAEHMINRT